MFDEADLLLCGSFQNQVVRLINMLRYDEKHSSQTSQSAADSPAEAGSESLLHVGLADEGDLLGANAKDFESDVEDEESEEENEAGSIKKKDWRRIRKDYDRSKQYIFVAATLPVNGKKTAGAVLKRMFPDANWVSGSYLHCHNPRCRVTFICSIFWHHSFVFHGILASSILQLVDLDDNSLLI